MVTHLLRTHLFMEPIAVATYRQLPTLHPLFKLLSPHIRGVLAINTLGRDVLIAEGGVADNTLTVGGGGNFFLKKIIHAQEQPSYLINRESSFVNVTKYTNKTISKASNSTILQKLYIELRW